MKKSKSFFSNFYSMFIAIFVAILVRSFLIEPFNIPSGSMKPNLLKGDFIFVTKWSYGYSKHSLPFSLPLIPNKIFAKIPNRGDVVVFKTPYDNKTDYIKRVIGLPGDKIKIINGQIYINNILILRKKIDDFLDIDRFGSIDNPKKIRQYKEYFFDLEISVLDYGDGLSADDTKLFTVPKDHFFVMGDNRDDSVDSRFVSVGFVPYINLVGKAQMIWFSLENSRFYQIWKWPRAIRFERIMKRIK